MSMLTLQGTLVNVYTNPGRKKDDGTSFEDRDKIQLLADVPLLNGQIRKELVSLTVKDGRKYEGREGESLSLPVGVMAPQKGTIVYYVLQA